MKSLSKHTRFGVGQWDKTGEAQIVKVPGHAQAGWVINVRPKQRRTKVALQGFSGCGTATPPVALSIL